MVWLGQCIWLREGDLSYKIGPINMGPTQVLLLGTLLSHVYGPLLPLSSYIIIHVFNIRHPKDQDYLYPVPSYIPILHY